MVLFFGQFSKEKQRHTPPPLPAHIVVSKRKFAYFSVLFPYCPRGRLFSLLFNIPSPLLLPKQDDMALRLIYFSLCTSPSLSCLPQEWESLTKHSVIGRKVRAYYRFRSSSGPMSLAVLVFASRFNPIHVEARSHHPLFYGYTHTSVDYFGLFAGSSMISLLFLESGFP